MNRTVLNVVVSVLLLSMLLFTAQAEVLEKGSKGDEVKAVQERLLELGYLTGKADGNFGKQSASAVEEFQVASGLPKTGVVDQTTKNVLFSPSAPYKPYELPQGVTLGMSFDEIQDIYKPLFLAYEKEYEKDAEEEDMEGKEEPGWSIEWNGSDNNKTPFLTVDVFGLNGIVTFTFQGSSLSRLKSAKYNFPVSEGQMQARGFEQISFSGTWRAYKELLLDNRRS